MKLTVRHHKDGTASTVWTIDLHAAEHDYADLGTISKAELEGRTTCPLCGETLKFEQRDIYDE